MSASHYLIHFFVSPSSYEHLAVSALLRTRTFAVLFKGDKKVTNYLRNWSLYVELEKKTKKTIEGN